MQEKLEISDKCELIRLLEAIDLGSGSNFSGLNKRKYSIGCSAVSQNVDFVPWLSKKDD